MSSICHLGHPSYVSLNDEQQEVKSKSNPAYEYGQDLRGSRSSQNRRDTNPNRLIDECLARQNI